MRSVHLATPLLGLLILIGAPAALAKKDTPDVRVDANGRRKSMAAGNPFSSLGSLPDLEEIRSSFVRIWRVALAERDWREPDQ